MNERINVQSFNKTSSSCLVEETINNFLEQVGNTYSEMENDDISVPRSVRISEQMLQGVFSSEKEQEDLLTVASRVCKKLNIITQSDERIFKPSNPSQSYRQTINSCLPIWKEFMTRRSEPPTAKEWSNLTSVNFNNWDYNDAQLLTFARHMFKGGGVGHSDRMKLTTLCDIPMDKLDVWLCVLYKNYNLVPFHNFKHAFMVLQVLFATMHIVKLYEYLPSLDLMILLFSALCHDLDHPGFNNTYQINAETQLATLYNDKSPLEMHHCSMAFAILRASPEDIDIFIKCNKDEKQWIRRAVIRCILSTDMAKHSAILKEFRQRLPELCQAARSMNLPMEEEDETIQEDLLKQVSFQIDSPKSILGVSRILAKSEEHRLILMCMLIKMSDISNEVRDLLVSSRWLDCLLQEFFNQAAVEKNSSLPVAAFMDPSKVTKETCQSGFIQNSLIPLLEEIAIIFPSLNDTHLAGARRQLAFYLSWKPEQVRKRPLRSSISDVPSQNVRPYQVNLLVEEQFRRHSTSRMSSGSGAALKKSGRQTAVESLDFTRLIFKNDNERSPPVQRSKTPPTHSVNIVQGEDRSRKSSTGSMVLASV